MRRSIENLYERYRAHHDMERPLLQWIGVVGFVAFPLFYLARRSSPLAAPGYDDLDLRLIASLLCLLLGLRRYWPERLKPFYIGYSYFTVFYCLSFFLSYTMLKNHGGTPGVVNMLMGAIIIILLADWRNTVFMLVAGYITSSIAFALTEPAMHFPQEFILGAGGSILVVVAGALSHYGQKRAELERMRRVYSGLAGSIAHEMRTPLAQLQHTLELVEGYLGRDGSPQSPAAARVHATELARAVAQGRHAVARGLQAITLTLQQLNGKAIDTGRFTRLSAAQCVREAVDEYAYDEAAERGRVSVLVIEDFNFRGDATAFVLILFNLLKNALYYAPVRPDLAVTMTIESRPVHRVTVRDTGPGIPPELMGRLFEEFQSAGKSEGTGLGLAFCRRAMHAFGGTIACSSTVGEFTQFTLTFPDLRPEEATPQPAPLVPTAAARAALAGQTVLVVDDSAFNRAIVKARLRELGVHAVEAQHGGDALQQIDEGLRPAAILMDMEMPGMSGIEATQALRRRSAPVNAIPVLALSANDLPAFRQSALDVGMNGYLTKPLQPELLITELARVLDLPLAPEPDEPVTGPGHVLAP